MQHELVELGEALRDLRQEKNISLQEVEQAISIKMSYLEAIEQGHLGKLISPIYAQGFIKQYATFLNLDGEALIEHYPMIRKVLSDKKGKFSDFNLEVSSIEIRGIPKRYVPSLKHMVWILGTAMVVLAVWWCLKRYGII